MKITLERTEQNSKLLRLMAHKDISKAMQAREAFASFITKPILDIIESEPVIGNLFTTWTYDYGTPASIPLAPLFDIKQSDFIKVWAAPRAGGLATSQNLSVDELMVMTYVLNSAVSFPLQYLRAARVDVVAAYLQRMAQEFLVKQEVNSFSVLGAVAAQSQYNKLGTATYQVIRTNTQGTAVPQDINALVTLMSRVNSSWVGGTPAGAGRSITSLVGSPEFHQVVANMAFEPLNTKVTTFPLGGPDQFREDIYKNTGNPSIYGIELINVYDMGVGYAYNYVFNTYASVANNGSAAAYPGFGGVGTATFSPGSEQVILGIDKRQDFLARLVENNPEDNSTLSVMADNQWSNRSEDVGFYSRLREGRVALDGRNVTTLIM